MAEATDLLNHTYVPDPATRPLVSIDLRTKYPGAFSPIYDQEMTNTCTANAVAAAIWYEKRRWKRSPDVLRDTGPSRLFIYWLARGGYKDDDRLFAFPRDGGSSVHEAMKGVVTCGVCPETAWPFEPENINVVPDQHAFDIASRSRIKAVYRIDSDRPRSNKYGLTIEQKDQHGATVLRNLKKCLTEQHPVVFEYSYRLPPSQSFDQNQVPWVLKDVWSEPDGKFPRHALPDNLPEELRMRNFCGEAISPAHIVLAIGYDDARQMVLIQNSRGASWGGNGTFWMPYAWITDYAATWDFWTVRA